jgi:hypothetical protein
MAKTRLRLAFGVYQFPTFQDVFERRRIVVEEQTFMSRRRDLFPRSTYGLISRSAVA